MRRLTRIVWDECAALAQWWLHEIQHLLADIQQHLAPGRPHRTTISLSLTHGTVMQDWRDGTVRSAEFARTASGDLPATPSEFWPTPWIDGATVHVVLPAEDALIHRLWLPASAERNLPRVIELQLERELPLPCDQVRIEWQIAARNHDRTRVEVLIAVLRRHELERLLDTLRQWKVRIGTVGVSVGGATACTFSPNEARRSTATLTRLDRRLAIGAGISLLVYLGVTAGQWMHERKVVAAAIAKANEPAVRVEGMRSRLASLQVPMTKLLELMQFTSNAEVLIDLTAAIPRDTWVQQLQIRSIDGNARLINMVAITPVATLLADHLSHTPHFSSVELQSAGLAQTIGSDLAEIQSQWRKSLVANPTDQSKP